MNLTEALVVALACTATSVAVSVAASLWFVGRYMDAFTERLERQIEEDERKSGLNGSKR